MTFSPQWNEQYDASHHLSVWPWSDVVSYFHRYAKPSSEFRRVLEVGCGAGANIPFFLSLGVEYQAIEGSAVIVERLKNSYPQLREKLSVGDFTKQLPGGEFDLVLDRGALCCNTDEAVRAALKLVRSVLRPGGKLIAIDWFSTEHEDAGKGEYVDDHTRCNFPATSHLSGIGRIHFSSRAHIEALLRETGFHLLQLEHKKSDIFPTEGSEIHRAWWNIVAEKP